MGRGRMISDMGKEYFKKTLKMGKIDELEDRTKRISTSSESKSDNEVEVMEEEKKTSWKTKVQCNVCYNGYGNTTIEKQSYDVYRRQRC